MLRASILLLALIATACGGGTSTPVATSNAPLLLAAGGVVLDPASETSWTGGLDLARLGITGVSAAYDVSTPSQAPFVIEALSRAPGNAGAVRLSVACCRRWHRAPGRPRYDLRRGRPALRSGSDSSQRLDGYAR